MLVIPFFAILNAFYGSGEHKGTWIGKWVCLPAAFIAVYAVSHDWILAGAWAAYFMVWRIPSLSKTGFKVWRRDTWREGADFMLFRSVILQGLLLIGYGVLKQFDIYRPEMLYMIAFPLIVAAIYSGVGYFFPITEDRHNRRIRYVEAACGLVLGVLIATSLYPAVA